MFYFNFDDHESEYEIHDDESKRREVQMETQARSVPLTMIGPITDSTEEKDTDQSDIRTFEVCTFHSTSSNFTLTVTTSDTIDVINKDRMSITDRIPGSYEGGFKIWSCALDLVKFLWELYLSMNKCDGNAAVLLESVINSTCLLELGCGHAVPTMVVMEIRRRLAIENTQSWSLKTLDIVLQDFNDDVLRNATMVNIRQSLGTVHSSNLPQSKTMSLSRVHLIGADWCQFAGWLRACEHKIPPPDFILGSDVTFTPRACRDVANVLCTCASQRRHYATQMHSTTTAQNPPVLLVRALLAMKKFYFGTDGGVACFKHELQQSLARADHSMLLSFDSVWNSEDHTATILFVQIFVTP